MEPTDDQYRKFGASVAGIMDAYVSYPEADKGRILGMIQVAADSNGITFKDVRA